MILQFCEWLENTALGLWIGESAWLFPILESVHVIALALVLGSIAMVDLRLMGVLSTNRRVTAVGAELIPFTWSAFVVAAITGILLFTSNAATYYANVPFRIKMILLVLAGINMAAFHLITYRTVAAWDNGQAAPPAAKVSAALSLSFWIAIVILGRWIGWV